MSDTSNPDTPVGGPPAQKGFMRHLQENYTPDDDNSNAQQDYFRERLPPAPGQYGADDQPPEKPYGFRQLASSVSPYIPTAQNPALRDRSHSDLGTNDWVLQGAMNGPEGVIPQGQFMPTERDIPQLMHNMTTTLGQLAPPGVAMPAIAMGKSYLMGNQNYMKGYMQGAQLHRENMLLNMKIADQQLTDLLKRYSSVLADYGPGPDKAGKDYNADKFHEKAYEVAAEYGDRTVLGIINDKDWGALERHLRHLDGTGQDLKKVLQQLQVDEATERLKWLKERNRKDQEKAKAADDALAPWRLNSATDPAAPAPTPPTGPGTSGDINTAPDKGNTNFDIDNLDDGRNKPGDEKDTEPERPPAPRSDDTAAPQDTAALAKQAKAAGAPVMARDDEPDEPAPTAKPAIPALHPAEPAPPAYQAQPSAVLDAFHKMGLHNDRMLEDYAIRYSNHTLTKEEAKDLPADIRRLIGERASELGQEYTRLARSGLPGDQILAQLKKINPEFGAAIETYVNGSAPPPISAWQNAAYRDRVMMLGHAIDPDFNYGTFALRQKTYNNYANGPAARQMQSFATLDLHAKDMIKDMQKLERMNPGFLKRYLGGEWALSGTPFAATTAEGRVFAHLDTLSQGIRDEFARATSGAAPHVGAQQEAEAVLNWRRTRPDIVIDALNGMQSMAHRRMGVLTNQYHAVMGPRQDPLGKLYDSYATRNPVDDPRVTPHAHEMLREQPPLHYRFREE